MIETLEQAEAALHRHEKWCGRLTCSFCDDAADVVDLLRLIGRVLSDRPAHYDPPRDEVIATLLEREAQPSNDGDGVIPIGVSHD